MVRRQLNAFALVRFCVGQPERPIDDAFPFEGNVELRADVQAAIHAHLDDVRCLGQNFGYFLQMNIQKSLRAAAPWTPRALFVRSVDTLHSKRPFVFRQVSRGGAISRCPSD